jgi:hypothetical protein
MTTTLEKAPVPASVTSAGVSIDYEAVLKALNLNPHEPKTQALLLVCDRYGLDPVLKHIVLISGNAYVTRDGYLAVAHRSGEFDGMEVLEQSETNTHYVAKVAVYRKDMGRPFTFVGRFPKSKSMAKDFGPEMAVKVAEVSAMRRAFNVTGLGAADERWDAEPDAPPAPALDPPRATEHGEIIDAEPVISTEQFGELMDLFKSITDGELRNEAKRTFIDLYGRPDHLPASKYDEALRVVQSQVAAQS